eukprot:TRINITY_DN5706_c0_g1_i1.p1 TRINITY_DN5706_c0_g1~~TRINITY_DN5706_c0_g1_i1.p1  ORF type:complete len:352 (-),score=88.10 TRINITY_DN5706_c0_g1_i1:21-1076(-)
MFQELLAKKGGLKHTTTKDNSAPVTKEKVAELDENQYHNTILDFNIEHWVHLLGDDVTPYTQFCEITIQDAKTFLEAYTALEENKQPQLDQPLQDHLQSLELKLQKVIDNVKADGECVFVKTSSRSAKNTIGASLVSLYKSTLAEYQKQHAEELTLNQKLICLLRAGTEQMKVYSAKQCIEIFCRSERIHGDFEIAMKLPERWQENFVIRRWTPMDCVMEFRTWVVDGKVTAITQYSSLIANPFLIENKEKVKAVLLEFFDKKVKEQLAPKYKKYVIDYGFEPESLERVWVVEVNPFLPTTSSVLFDWGNDADLLNGTNAAQECEFRIRTEPPLGILASMIPEWKAIIQDN